MRIWTWSDLDSVPPKEELTLVGGALYHAMSLSAAIYKSLLSIIAAYRP